MTSRRCTAVCLDGSPCRAWAVQGTHPPRCAAHGGVRRRGDASSKIGHTLQDISYADSELPEDCCIDAIIDNLYQRQVHLDAYIDGMLQAGGLSIRELAYLLRIHGQNATRLGRLLRDRRALSGDAADGIAGAIAQALDELGSELGVDL